MRSTKAKGPYTGGVDTGGASPGALTTTPTWLAFSFTYAQLSDASTDKDIELYSLPAKGVLSGVFVKNTIVVAGGTLSSYLLKVGIAGMLDLWVPGFDAFVAVSNVNTYLAEAFSFQSYGAVTSIRLGAHSVDDFLNAATQGAFEVQLLLSELA